MLPSVKPKTSVTQLARRPILVLCTLGIVAVLLVGNSFSVQTKLYDGDWWHFLTTQEQEGFIFGYGECYSEPPGDNIRVSLDDGNTVLAVAIFYQGHQKLRTRPVAEVLKDIWSGHIPVHEAQHVTPGEGWRERHGYFDGLWWKGSSNVEQLGFVEGYLACHNLERRHVQPLPLPPSRYVDLLNAWYHPGGDESVAAQHQADKIAAVLLRYSGRAASPR